MLSIMAGVMRSDHDCWHVGCGHDMTAALAVLLSARSGRDILSYTVERQLRLSYHPTDFASTALYKKIVEWEQRNGDYRILRNL